MSPRRTKAQMMQLGEQLLDVLAADHPQSARHLFYRMTDPTLPQPVEKSEAGYTTVQRLLVQLRRDGIIPYGWITDSTRRGWFAETYAGPEKALRRTAQVYRRSYWDSSPDYLEVWCESRSIAGVIQHVCEEYAVPLYPSGGFASLSLIHGAAENIVYEAADRPVHILYIGDHDPAGVLIDRKIEIELRGFLPDTDLSFHRLAVTAEQIDLMRLPTKPPKDRRGGFAGGTVEAEAIGPSPNVTRHTFREREFTDLADMLKALRGAAIEGETLIRARPKAWTGRRAIHDCKEKGPAGLEVVPRAHVSLDWDRLSGKAKLTNGEPADPLLHPEAFVAEAMLALPREWRDKSCVVQTSASAGLKGVRIRTHHILDKPRLGKDIKTWLRPAIERGILDPVTLVECQPIYLAVTVIGGHDPCPERFKLVEMPGGEIVPTAGLDRTLERNRALAEQEQERRDKISHALRARGWSADTVDLTEFAIKKAEAAIVRAGSGSRHPTYVEQMARLRAIIDRHGGDWPAAAHRLRSAYLATLTAAEAAQRQRGSTEGVVRWLENLP